MVGTVGFLNECSREARPDDSGEWSVKRPRPELVIYRMDPSIVDDAPPDTIPG